MSKGFENPLWNFPIMEKFAPHDQPKFEQIKLALETVLGLSEDLHRSSPLASCRSGLETFLATILTQATNDRNAMYAWHRLQECFPDPRRLLTVPLQELTAVIRPAGLAAQKAKTIQNALQRIQNQLGVLSLEELKEADPETALAFLVGLPGIGPKTAACTMLFGLGIPAFPVDTHIDRIIRRLGWIDPKTDTAGAQLQLSREIPFPLQAALHILLLNLGRIYCRPTKPRCTGVTSPCPLFNHCPTAHANPD